MNNKRKALGLRRKHFKPNSLWVLTLGGIKFLTRTNKMYTKCIVTSYNLEKRNGIWVFNELRL